MSATHINLQYISDLHKPAVMIPVSKYRFWCQDLAENVLKYVGLLHLPYSVAILKNMVATVYRVSPKMQNAHSLLLCYSKI